MEEYKLTKSDFDELEELIKTVNSIEVLYKKLYELEISNKKNSEEYKKTIEYLKIALEVEADKYKKILYSSDKSISIIEHLLLGKVSEDESEMEYLFSQNNSNRVVNRIAAFIKKELLRDYSLMRKFLPQELSMVLKYVEIEDPEQMIMDSFKTSRDLQETAEQEILNVFIKMIEEFIVDKNYNEFRNQLLRVKYDVAFVNKEVESQMMFNNFNTLSTLLFDSKFMKDILKINNFEYKIFCNKYAFRKVALEMDKIIKSWPFLNNNESIAFPNLLRQVYLRSLFLLMDEDIIEDLREHLEMIREELNFFGIHNSKGFDLISEALEKNEEDRETYKGESSNDMKLKLDPEEYGNY